MNLGRWENPVSLNFLLPTLGLVSEAPGPQAGPTTHSWNKLICDGQYFSFFFFFALVIYNKIYFIVFAFSNDLVIFFFFPEMLKNYIRIVKAFRPVLFKLLNLQIRKS